MSRLRSGGSMRVAVLAILVCAATAVVTGAYFWMQNETYGALEAATERIASAVARDDQQALAGDPLLAGRPETVAQLRQYQSVLASGYRIRITRNRANGKLPPDKVTHLGAIETSCGTLFLGFRFDRDTGELGFVGFEFSIID